MLVGNKSQHEKCGFDVILGEQLQYDSSALDDPTRKLGPLITSDFLFKVRDLIVVFDVDSQGVVDFGQPDKEGRAGGS